MKVYCLGSNDASETAGQVLVVVELVTDITDLKGVQTYQGKPLKAPFYLQCNVNCGKIESISDLTEEHKFETANMCIDDEMVSVTIGKYFDVPDYNYQAGRCLKAYRNKVAAVEHSSYVNPTFTGVKYTHFPSGNIGKKSAYVKGDLHSEKLYRDDAFNTLEGCRVYHKGKVQCEFTYDDTETLLSQAWYNGDGTLYTEDKTKLVVKALSKVAPPPDTPVLERTKTPEPDHIPVQEPESESSEESGTSSTISEPEDDAPDGNTGSSSNSKEGTCRLKPKPTNDETASESESSC